MEEGRKERLPLISYIFFGAAAVLGIIYAIAMRSTALADFFNGYISAMPRWILANITNILPLSLVEIGIITLPVSMFFIIRYCTRKYGGSWHDAGIFALVALSVVALIFALFVLIFGVGYYTSDLEDRLELTEAEMTAEELAGTAEWLISEVNSLVDTVEFSDGGSSVSPYSVRQMNMLLLDAYADVSEEYSFIPRFTSFVKPIMLSEPMCYTHISGVYTYFTGEANVNIHCPDYSLPFTAAHELAHQRGIAREDEANFIAFLVCSRSEDNYIRYCGYMNLCEYVLNALYACDKDLWSEVCADLDRRAIREMVAYNEFYEKYNDNVVGNVSGAINDAYLQANGTEGTVSYGLVARLAVAYFNKNVASEYNGY